MEKWDAWRECAGLSRTEAKRRYIEVLIQTMKVYAAGTTEARELVSELEFVWDQIRGQRSSSDESIRNSGRAGAGVREDAGEAGRLRVLSPVSRGGGSGEIVEGEDASIPEREGLGARNYNDQTAEGQEEEEDDEEEDFRDAPDGSEAKARRPLDRRRKPYYAVQASEKKWRHQVETALTKITTELAALREQLEELNLYSSSPFYNRSGFGFLGKSGRRKSGLVAWTRWLVWVALRQIALDAVLLAMLLLWGVRTGDRRVERWVGRRWSQVRTLAEGLRAKWDGMAGGAVFLVRAWPARFLS